MQEGNITKSQQFFATGHPTWAEKRALATSLVILVLSLPGVSAYCLHDNAVRMPRAVMATRHAEKQKAASAVVRHAVLPSLHSTVARVRACWTPQASGHSTMAVVADHVRWPPVRGNARRPLFSLLKRFEFAQDPSLCSPTSYSSLARSTLPPQTRAESGTAGR